MNEHDSNVSNNNRNQILEAIGDINSKLDDIKDSLHEMKLETNNRLGALESWKLNQDPNIAKLEARIEQLDQYRQKTDQALAESRIKDKVTVWAVNIGITLLGSAAVHFALHQASK